MVTTETMQKGPSSTAPAASDYGESNITVLEGLEAVRKRPGMYIGDVHDGSALHHLVWECVDNAVDEHLAGFCSLINVTVHFDGSVTVEDNGRGIPVGIKPDPDIFTMVEYNYGTLANRLRELAFLNSGLVITLEDERTEGQKDRYEYKGGIKEFVALLSQTKEPVHEDVVAFNAEAPTDSN